MEQCLKRMASLFIFVHILTGAQTTPTTQQLYVKPTECTPCPEEPCHTLDQYMQNATRYFVSNTVFNFLPGMHPMRQALSVCNISNLSMVTTSGTAKITCQIYPELSFSEIYTLTLQDLTFVSCTSLAVYDVFNLKIHRVAVQPLNRNSTGPFLNVTNIFGKSIISEFQEIIHNGFRGLHHITIQYTNWSSAAMPLTSQSHLTFRDFFFTCPFIRICSEVYLGFYQSHFDVTVAIENVTMSSNLIDINIEIDSEANNNISIANSQFIASGGIDVLEYPAKSNSNLHIANCHFEQCIENLQLKMRDTMLVPEHSSFSQSLGVKKPSHYIGEPMKGDALTVHKTRKPVVITNVTFCSARSNWMYDSQPTRETVPPSVVSVYNTSHVEFRDCKFSSNERASTLTVGTVVFLLNAQDISFSNCEFSDNNRTAISAYDTTLALKGTVSFIDNSGTEGAAMLLYGNSFVQLQTDTSVLFQGNSAENVGGAILVRSFFIPLTSKCFFQLPSIEHPYNCSWYQMKTNVSLSFVNNTAVVGGNDIYGASLDFCIANSLPWECNGTKEFLSTFFNLAETDTSAISSDPLRVCLCRDGLPDCAEIFTDLSSYPGQSFHVYGVIVGDTFGEVDGSAYAHTFPFTGSYSSKLSGLQQTQHLTHQQCSNLTYTVFSNSREVVLVLSANSKTIESYPSEIGIKILNEAIYDYSHYGNISPILRTAPIFINVTLLPCPLGFVLSDESHGCICDPQLEENNIPCNLSTQTVRRSGTVWVNASFKDGRANGVIVNKHCPHYYCKREAVNVDLEYPDSQCAFHRSGILCGGCQSGLSLTLGSAQCLPCSNHFLALLIPFAVAGFALVFFLKVLNLTVAIGTINGLIFYANIVQANQDEWLPAEHNILTAFIAWFNLDLGIETCFFVGLDGYWKTWLQFIFPLYIWAIMIVVIILSHKYSTVAKIVKGNSVPVLATLFLLSYTKLLRIIISILQTSNLNYPDGTTRAVWTYDGNISYLSPKHIPMLVLALLVLVVLGVPYTLFLLFAQCIQRMDSQILRRVLIRLKPFLDAYFGPLRDKHRYWVGLLLLVRCVLITVISATPTNQSSVSLMIAAVTVCTLIMDPYIGHVYKRNYLNLLENSLFLNLGVLAIGTLYIRESGGNQAALAYTCVGVAFVQFITIVLFHTATAIHSTGLIQRYCQRKREHEGSVSEEEDLLAQYRVQGMSMSVQGYYREPVLRYLDDQDNEPQPPA